MLISELHNHLIHFVESQNPTRTMLIDGKWGCGKTFSVNQFVEDHFKANYIYLSLFGIKRKEDIVIRLSEYLDSSFIANINGEYSLESPLKQSIFNGAIIMFDDLERADDNLSFSSIYGVVDGLRNLGFKIICICNSIPIVDKKDFNDFREKTFDVIINVEADVAQFSQITGINVDFEKSLLESVNGNWRIIKRAVFVYNDILQTAEKNDINNLLQLLYLDESAFFRCVVLAELCFFGEKQEAPKFDAKDFNKVVHEHDVEELGEIVGNNFYLLFTNGEENNIYKEKVRIILISLNHCDSYKTIFEVAKPKVANTVLEQYPFDKELFYLDDRGHLEYKNEFFNNLNTFDFSDKQQQRVLVSVISNCLDELTKQEIDLIIKRIVETVPSENSGSLLETIILSYGDRDNKFDTFINELRNKFKNKANIESKKAIDVLASRRDYKELTNYLYENKYTTSDRKETILIVLKENDFFLPDLSKEVNYSSWGYCHEVARFVAETDYEDLYINVLKNQCKQSRSIELRKKCNALVKYNFKIKIDFFELYPIKNDQRN